MKSAARGKIRIWLLSLFLMSAWSPEALAMSGCPTTAVMADHLTEKSAEHCGAEKIVWDLSDFVPDGTVCESRQQGLNLVARVVQDLCESKIDGDDITTKLTHIKVTAHLGTGTEYVFLRKQLNAKVPIKEAPVLTKWNEELLKLKTFLRTSTGLPLASRADREKLQADAKQAEETKKRQADRELAEKKRQEDNKKRETEAQQREAKVTMAKQKLQAAVENYQKKAKEIWSRPDSTPDGMEKKKLESEAALQELNRAQSEFQAEVSAIK